MFGGGGSLSSGLSQTVSLALQMRALRNQENEALQRDAQYISQRANSLTPTQMPFFLDEVGLAEQRWGPRWPQHLRGDAWNAPAAVPASAAGAVGGMGGRPSPGYGSFAAERADVDDAQAVNLDRYGGNSAREALDKVANALRGGGQQGAQAEPRPIYQDTSGMAFLADPEGIVMTPDAPKELQNTWGKWQSQIKQAAEEAGIDPRLLAAVVARESGGDPNARSGAGALGLAQLMPATAESLGVNDPTDPMQNLRGGATYLKQLSDKYNGDMARTLAAYNFGMGNVDSGKAYPMETRKYIQDVTSWYAGFDMDGVGKEAAGNLNSVAQADIAGGGDPMLVASQLWTDAIKAYGHEGAIEVMRPALNYLDQAFQNKLSAAKGEGERQKMVNEEIKLAEDLLQDAFFGKAGFDLNDPEGMMAALFPQDRVKFRRMQAEMIKQIGAMDNSGGRVSGARAFSMVVDEFGGPSGFYDMDNSKSMETFSALARPWMTSVGEKLNTMPDRSDWFMRVDSYDNRLLLTHKTDPRVPPYEITEQDAFISGTDSEPLQPSRAEDVARATGGYSLQGATTRMGNAAANQGLASAAPPPPRPGLPGMSMPAGANWGSVPGMSPGPQAISPTAATGFFGGPRGSEDPLTESLRGFFDAARDRQGRAPRRTGPGYFVAGGGR